MRAVFLLWCLPLFAQSSLEREIAKIASVEMPGGGRLLIAIFLKGSNQDEASRERTIAEISRAIFDAWTHQ